MQTVTAAVKSTKFHNRGKIYCRYSRQLISNLRVYFESCVRNYKTENWNKKDKINRHLVHAFVEIYFLTTTFSWNNNNWSVCCNCSHGQGEGLGQSEAFYWNFLFMMHIYYLPLKLNAKQAVNSAKHQNHTERRRLNKGRIKAKFQQMTQWTDQLGNRQK